MANIKIYESVGGNSETVTNYRELENHHPSKGLQESGRVYARVGGESEEILGNYRGGAVLTPGGEYMVSKDMVLTAPGLSNGNVPIPSPAAGVIGNIDRTDGIITINDPKTGDTMFQIRHAQVDPNLKPGDKIEYGQSLGLQHGYNNGNPNAFPDHVHFDVNTKYIGQADKWIKDMDSGALTTDKRPAQTENLVTERPSFVPISGNFPKPADPPLADGKLSIGEKGPEVEKLQLALKAAGAVDAKGNELNPDKDFGERTREAVLNYQKTHGQPETGVADRKMLTDLGVIAPQQNQQQNQTPPTQTQTPPQTPAQEQTQTPPQQPAGNKVPGGPNDYGSTNPLGTLISSGEGGYGSYNRGRAGDANGAQIDFSQMTVGEVMRRQDLAKGDPDRLFAVGKYQMIPGTFEEGVNALGIDRNAKFTPQLQERMFADFLVDEKRPQVKDYITGETNGAAGLQGAQLALAREFASVADPRTGRSVYDGDSAGNSASITAAQVGTALDQMRGQYQQNIKSGMSADEAYRALSGDPTQIQNGQTQGNQTPRGQSGSTSDTLLVKEERGDGVKGLQEALNNAGVRDAQGQPLPTTGYFGDKTEEAVRKYQEQKGLEVDGKAGKDTLTALGIYPGQQQTPADKPQTPANAQPTPTENPQTPANAQPTPADKPQTPANAQPTPTDNPQAPANAQPTPTDKPQTPANAQPTPTDNPQNPANAQPTQTDKPLMSNPNHPDNKLYQQALSNLEQLGPSAGFKSREDMEKAAAAVAADAKATGLQSIDHVSKTAAPNGQNFLVAVQGDPTSPASKNSYVDYNQATTQTVAQSTGMAEAQKPAVQQAQQADQTQQQNNQDQNKVAIGAR